MIKTTFNESAINKAFANLDKQVRFAAAQALTKTAQDVQQEVRRQLPERFTIRTPWLAQGIRIIPATPTKLESAVVVKDEFMAVQETGGDKQSISGKAMGIPVGARPTPMSVTRPSQFPGALLSKAGYFIAPIAKGSKTNGVWKRTGKGRLQLMYVFEQKIYLKPRFGFLETSRKVAMDRMPKRFAEALRQALATAK